MKRFSALFVLGLLALTDCSGGGTSSSGTIVPTNLPAGVYPLQSIFDHALTTAHSHTLTTTLPSGAVQAEVFSDVPGSQMSFEGTLANTVDVTEQYLLNGVFQSQRTFVSYRSPAVTNAPLGWFYQNDNHYEVVTSYSDYPSTAQIGQSSNIYQSTLYSDSSKTTVLSNTTATWELDHDLTTPNNALFCRVYTTIAASPQGANNVETDCIPLSSSGDTGSLTTTFVQNGVTLTYHETQS